MNHNHISNTNHVRKSEHEINPVILNRHSSRAMSGEEISDEELMPLFEAARWAPSSFNGQLWRFIYAKRDTKRFDEFFDLLTERNKLWCKNASALVILISRTHDYKNRHSPTSSFDSGSAFQNMALEASHRNMIAHPIGGFDNEKANKLLKLSDKWKVEIMIAVGKKGRKEDLPQEFQESEKPTLRKPLNEIVFKDEFKED